MPKSLKIKCNITGKESFFSGDYLNKKVDEYGSIENMEQLYISRDVKTLLKRGYNVNEVRNILNVSDDIPLPAEEIIKEIEDKFSKNGFKLPTINESLTGFTYNKSDEEVEIFINKHIIKS